MECEFKEECGKNCILNKSNNRAGVRMNMCDDWRNYLEYLTKITRKLKLEKINERR